VLRFVGVRVALDLELEELQRGLLAADVLAELLEVERGEVDQRPVPRPQRADRVARDGERFVRIGLRSVGTTT
jgi:hypothetical protein